VRQYKPPRCPKAYPELRVQVDGLQMSKACGIPLSTQKMCSDKYQSHAGTEESKRNLGQAINHKRMCPITLLPDAKLQLVECIVRMQEVDIDLNEILLLIGGELAFQ
jgi:hypothetical protein